MEVRVPSLPDHPNLDHLKEQAKDLLRDCRAESPAALARMRASLPAARRAVDDSAAAMTFRLHDAQSCVAREYGFASWEDLRAAVLLGQPDEQHLVHRWLALVYGVHERSERARPLLAEQLFERATPVLRAHPIVACALGDVEAMRRLGLLDSAAINRAIKWTCPDCGATYACPPLVAVTHSSLLRLRLRAGRVRDAARALIAAGADVNARWDVAGFSLSALYGAAGLNHDAELTQVLLSAGADPNDNESLYHATEGSDPTCVSLLLAHGARVEGSNALHHQLDREDLDGLQRLLDATTDVDDSSSTLGPPLLWAIRRGRSVPHVRALIDRGANPRAQTKDGVSAFVLAQRNGLTDVVALLDDRGAGQALTVEEQFVAACARVDRPAAMELLERHPDMFTRLTTTQLRQLPNLTEAGRTDAVRLMVELGWPVATTGGDWQASAVNLAVFRGDAALTRFLLEHGARWDERHGYGDHTRGTLSWASRNLDPAGRDFIGCAHALLDHGMPLPSPDEPFSDEVMDFFAEERRRRTS
jgi:hypothetical protein